MGNTEKNTRLCQILCQIDAGIKTYSELEHIQMHPEMYIGQLGNGEKQGDGIYALLRKIIDNSVKEFQIGHGREIEVTVTSDDEVTVRDYGKGIPFEDLVRYASPVNVCPGCIMAPGSKWTPPPASMKIVNAFSRHFTVISRRGGMSMTVTYENGELKKTQKGMVADADGTEVSFVLSIRTFPGFHYCMKHLRHWMQHYARLHPGLILVLTSVEVFFCHTPS